MSGALFRAPGRGRALTVAGMPKRAAAEATAPGDRVASSVLAAAAGRWARRLQAHRFARFLVVGAVNTAVGYSLFLLALAWLSDPTAAVLASTALSALFNFLTTGRLVFGSTAPRRLPGFLAVYGVVFIYNAAAIRLGAGVGLDPRLAGFLALPGAVGLSYGLQRWGVFRRDLS